MGMTMDVNRRILAAIAAGVTLSACSDRALTGPVADDDGSSDSSSSASSMTTSTASTTAPATSSTTDAAETSGVATGTSSQDDGDEGPRFDLGIAPDFDIVPYPAGCEAPPVLPQGCAILPEQEVVFGCLEVDGACPDADDPLVGDSLFTCVIDNHCVDVFTTCGPVEGTTPCCYWGEVAGQCPGRPFVVAGRERLAAVIERNDWASSVAADIEHLEPTLREALAAAWAEDARFEHASIASFARFVLHLLALGAPASLVTDASRAIAEELAHARAFFELASRYASGALGPGPLDVTGALDHADDAAAIVAAAVAEGCIAETISAQHIAHARDHADDPIVRARLDTIAREELAHAELAWRFVAWAHASGGTRVRAAIADAFAQPERHIPRGTGIACPPGAEASWSAHGRLTDDERIAIARTTLARIVGPCAAVLTRGERSHAFAAAELAC